MRLYDLRKAHEGHPLGEDRSAIDTGQAENKMDCSTMRWSQSPIKPALAQLNVMQKGG